MLWQRSMSELRYDGDGVCEGVNPVPVEALEKEVPEPMLSVCKLPSSSSSSSSASTSSALTCPKGHVSG